jgi:hypothetical protein
MCVSRALLPRPARSFGPHSRGAASVCLTYGQRCLLYHKSNGKKKLRHVGEGVAGCKWWWDGDAVERAKQEATAAAVAKGERRGVHLLAAVQGISPCLNGNKASTNCEDACMSQRLISSPCAPSAHRVYSTPINRFRERRHHQH